MAHPLSLQRPMVSIAWPASRAGGAMFAANAIEQFAHAEHESMQNRRVSHLFIEIILD
jgi:hypothetical protein